MDVVPIIAPFGIENTLYIPDKKLNSWLETNPPGHTEWTTEEYVSPALEAYLQYRVTIHANSYSQSFSPILIQFSMVNMRGL